MNFKHSSGQRTLPTKELAPMCPGQAKAASGFFRTKAFLQQDAMLMSKRAQKMHTDWLRDAATTALWVRAVVGPASGWGARFIRDSGALRTSRFLKAS